VEAALPIRTDRLILRRYTRADAPDVIEFAQHPSVDRATPDFEATKSGVQAYIELQNSYQPFEKGKCFDLAVELKATQKVIGLLSLVRGDHQKAEIGYALGVDYRGQGLAAEAVRALINYGFRWLGLHRIYAQTDSGNRPSWRVMERVGMRQEGRLREAVCRDGVWLDVLVYGILAEEWDRT
jgi:RimJ/RimL family protein N-acetyltransferase